MQIVVSNFRHLAKQNGAGMGRGKNERAYQTAILAILGMKSATAGEELRSVLRKLPCTAQTIKIGIFPLPEGTGIFDVVISLEGADTQALNRAIQDHRMLFCCSKTDSEFLQSLIRAQDLAGFSVQDTIVDAAAIWVAELWEAVAFESSPIPGLVYGDDRYGTTTPRSLNVRADRKIGPSAECAP